MRPRVAQQNRRSGCGLLVVASIVTCLLLLVNRVFATTLYTVLVPAKFDFVRLRIMMQFLFMVGLLLPEWWLIDRITQILRAFLFPGDTKKPDGKRPS